jgi:hypothetical protein
MKPIMSALVVLIVGFALFSSGNNPAVYANRGPACWAGFCPAADKPATNDFKDADRTRSIPTKTPRVTPNPMGSLGM